LLLWFVFVVMFIRRSSGQ